MRAMVFDRCGEPDVLHLKDLPIPEPQDAGLVHVPPIHVLLLEDAALAHQLIDTSHVRGKLLLRVAALYA